MHSDNRVHGGGIMISSENRCSPTKTETQFISIALWVTRWNPEQVREIRIE